MIALVIGILIGINVMHLYQDTKIEKRHKQEQQEHYEEKD